MECKGEVLSALFENQSFLGFVSDVLGVSRSSIKDFWTQRLNPLIELKSLMELVRAEFNGILQAAGTLTGGLDTTLTIAPSRPMAFAEAAALPVTSLPVGYFDVDRCFTLPGDAFRHSACRRRSCASFPSPPTSTATV